ncbi:MAG: aromatic amino acid hydroxylase [Bacteroidales bacterium]|nr:aromatic amino acid hydroxylase [Bacteroidales bacterium]
MTNPAVKRLPDHLKKYIVDQRYSDYTSIDHAVWRYIMRQSFHFLHEHAHSAYMEGLYKTGISIEKIPNIEEMNEMLAKIGWGAVCVDGFIPPNAFMEFQAYNVLVIAADIRFIEHIEYTPAPDIVHEAAGHAPIIANPEYAEYLRLFGEIGSKALSSKMDTLLYEAIRKLSILKENPNSTEKEIQEAEHEVLNTQNNMGELSEMAKIRNLHWWTVEYGLIGSLENPKIYGAGLLSSLSESQACLNPLVAKIPYSIETANYSFDITTQQPQLFVTPDFSHLTVVLNQFADTMALRKGGAVGVKKAIDSQAVATIELDSGLQISGIFSDAIYNDDGNVAWFKTVGPTILCEQNKLLSGHGAEYHSHGYSSPIGTPFGFEKPLKMYRFNELKALGIDFGKMVNWEFNTGIQLSGKIYTIRKNRNADTLIISFIDCTVSYKEKILFQPDWGIFDMAVGQKVVSVYAGSADKTEYDPDSYVSDITTQRFTNLSPRLIEFYSAVRTIRETNPKNTEKLGEIFKEVKIHFPNDWLLSLEILELLNSTSSLHSDVKDYLIASQENEHYRNLIINGLNLIE